MWAWTGSVTHQCCKHNNECWEIFPQRAGGTEWRFPQWRRWPASHRWSWKTNHSSPEHPFMTSELQRVCSRCSDWLALVEGLHGTLPLLQFKLHHPSQICSICLEAYRADSVTIVMRPSFHLIYSVSLVRTCASSLVLASTRGLSQSFSRFSLCFAALRSRDSRWKRFRGSVLASCFSCMA